MALTLLLAAAAAAQSPIATVDISVVADDRLDVAFIELTEGRNREAIERLERIRADGDAEPAQLINLGTAYARAGRKAEAKAMFTSAVASRDAYALELADGTWLNSRRAARVALRYLDQGKVLALR